MSYALLLERIAHEHGLEPELVLALVAQESGGNVYAWNPEPPYRYLVDCRTGRPFRPLTPTERASEVPPRDFPAFAGDRDQEWWGQQASWGLMQIMGAVAREQGFRGPYLPELCEAHVNLQFGCRVLASNIRWAGGNVAKALGAYNAGRGGATGSAGTAYGQKVLARLARLKAGEDT